MDKNVSSNPVETSCEQPDRFGRKSAEDFSSSRRVSSFESHVSRWSMTCALIRLNLSRGVLWLVAAFVQAPCGFLRLRQHERKPGRIGLVSQSCASMAFLSQSTTRIVIVTSSWDMNSFFTKKIIKSAILMIISQHRRSRACFPHSTDR